MADKIDYGNLMHDAMRGLIRRVLGQVAREGLPGEHHFYITFDTRQPGVELAEWLRERFPETMTIVMQHWFDGLEVKEDGFHVTLNFNDTPEPMFIPYDAIRTFVDPSVEFGLKFENNEDAAEPAARPEPVQADGRGADETGETGRETGRETGGNAEVVSLDAFRK